MLKVLEMLSDVGGDQLSLSLHIEFTLAFVGNPVYFHLFIWFVVLLTNVVLQTCVVCLIFAFKDINVEDVVPKEVLVTSMECKIDCLFL